MNTKVKEKTLSYIGCENPASPLEVEFEIVGLKSLILKAEIKIKSLEQSKILAQNELEKLKQKTLEK